MHICTVFDTHLSEIINKNVLTTDTEDVLVICNLIQIRNVNEKHLIYFVSFIILHLKKCIKHMFLSLESHQPHIQRQSNASFSLKPNKRYRDVTQALIRPPYHLGPLVPRPLKYNLRHQSVQGLKRSAVVLVNRFFPQLNKE